MKTHSNVLFCPVQLDGDKQQMHIFKMLQPETVCFVKTDEFVQRLNRPRKGESLKEAEPPAHFGFNNSIISVARRRKSILLLLNMIQPQRSEWSTEPQDDLMSRPLQTLPEGITQSS